MRTYLSALGACLLGGLLGALLGLGIEQAAGQSGWALTIGALGANAGAYWAGARRAADKPIWPRPAARLGAS
jgi:hypothetical protein